MKKITKILFISLTILIATLNLLSCLFLNNNMEDQLFKIVNSSILFIISIVIGVIIIKAKTINIKHLLFGSLILIFVTINFLDSTSIFSFPTKKTVSNFSMQNLEVALDFAKKNDVKLNIIYEYSDNIKEYDVISQNVEPGTILKNVKEITLIVSQGPDPNKNVIVPNMLGWDTKKVLEFVNNNFLTNVDVNFTKSEEKQNTVIAQNVNGEIKRNSNLSLTFSQGTEDLIDPVSMEDFSNKSTFEATLWLKMNGINTTLEYAFNDDYRDTLTILDKDGNKLDILKIKKGNILTQSVKPKETVTPGKDNVILTVSKGKKVIIPDFKNMSVEDVTSFVIQNKLKIKYLDNYDDTVAIGKIISASHNTGDVVEEGTEITITSSKGQLKMEEFKTVAEFKDWATKYNIKYEEIKENSDTIKEGEIIRFSIPAGQIIKNGETIQIVISKGAPVVVPNFISKSRSQILSECKNLGISVKFVYSGGFNNNPKDTCLSQSVAAGNKVDRGTQITITLSKGPGVTVPNLVSLSKDQIIAKCNSLSLNVTFKTGSYSSTPEGHAVSQSIAAGNKVNNGTTIVVTLSKGPAKSKTVAIQNNWIVAGNANASGSNIKKNLEAELPGCIVQINYVPTNGNNIGLPASGNVVTLTQGKVTVVNIYR